MYLYFGFGGGFMNEIVKYNNHMNLLKFDSFTSMEFNMFFALCSIMKEQQSTVITLSFEEIRKLTNYKPSAKKRLIDDIKSMNQKLQNMNSLIEMDGVTLMLVLFPTFKLDEVNQELTVRVNPDFIFLLNDLTSNFTLFELREFVNLKSKYSKTLYRLLKQWRSTGKYEVTDVGNFHHLIGAPDSYNNWKVFQRCIEPAVTELTQINSFKDLRISVTRRGDKGNIQGYVFTFPCEPKTIIENKSTTTSAMAYSISKDGTHKTPRTKNNFLNFEQRIYDDETLERIFSQNAAPIPRIIK